MEEKKGEGREREGETEEFNLDSFIENLQIQDSGELDNLYIICHFHGQYLILENIIKKQ